MSGHNSLQEMAGGAIFEVKDPGNGGKVIVDRWGAVCSVKTAGAETRTLPQPGKAGLMCVICLGVDGGDLTLTVTGGYNSDGDTAIVFGDAGDYAAFVSVRVGASCYWRLMSQEGTDAAVETLSVDAATIAALTVAALNYTPVTRAASADGTGDGTIAASGMLQFVTVTSANANNIIVLPAPVPGTIVILRNGTTGYELRTSAPATVSINGGAGANAESAIAASTMVVAICTSATTWQAIGLAGTTLAAVEAAA